MAPARCPSRDRGTQIWSRPSPEDPHEPDRVLLTGTVEDRIARAAQDFGTTLEEAARRREPEDEIRADMSIVLYGWDPREPERYDLVIDTSVVPLESAVDEILTAVREARA